MKLLGVESFFVRSPLTFTGTGEWIIKNTNNISCGFISLEEQVKVTEIKPIVIGYPVTKRFSRNYERNTKKAFVAVIPRARVFGEYSNFIITPDNQVLADVSREFGAEGGVKPENFSIFHNRVKMPEMERLKGNIAVVSTCGSNNFHHWNFDVLPRLDLLARAGHLKDIDKFIIHHSGLKFQLEGLSKFDIKAGQIINPKGHAEFFIEAETLFIPSLPEDLGTISPWVIKFLRKTFLGNKSFLKQEKKLFLSRRHAPSRKIINQQDVSREIFSRGFQEFIPEDFSMEEVAEHFCGAMAIVSVHGSGLSNLPFIEQGTKVLDIMAPYHQDPYYWMMCNQRKGKYVALFAEGEHPPDGLDLVKNKIDDDLLIDITKLKEALDQIS
jgi:capsular polysaccharide biosynthesis protein